MSTTKSTKKVTTKSKDKSDKSDKAKTHKLSLKGSSKLVAEFYFSAVKKYGLTMLVSSDDQVKAYIKKIMSQLDKWMINGKITKLIVVITSKETGEDVERWQFDVEIFNKPSKKSSKSKSTTTPTTSENAPTEKEVPAPAPEKTEAEIQLEIQSIFRQITASVTFLPELDGACTFNVLVYADADSEVPMEWGDSDAREIVNGEKVQLRSFSTANHKVGTMVSYKSTGISERDGIGKEFGLL
ncbi:hypothetical protein EYC84_001607 [Monilinia fructicola]|uniref:HORMA domain-containing protein n=1 Tax=Monilinia fructicola TaxID=38448 RepID=A0A5M9JSL8_MONFR|nr:hypothetical protein EYC84_001607 [Monilinia fructicola]